MRKVKTKMKVKSLQTKLLLLLLPFFILAFIVLSGTSYYLANYYLVNSISETATSLGEDYSNQVKADIYEKMAHIEELCSLPQFQSANDNAQILTALISAKKRLNEFDNFVFMFPDGVGIRADGSSANYINDASYKKVLETKKPVVSDPLVSKITGKMVVVLAVPVIRDGQLKGMISAVYPLDELSESVKALKFKENGYGYLVNQSGTVIAHPNQELIGKLNLSETKANRELKTQIALDERLAGLFKATIEKDKQVQGNYNTHDGLQMAVFTPIDLPGDMQWIMIITAPEVEVYKDSAVLARTMVLISLTFIIIAVGFITLLSKRFIKPLLSIKDECMLLAQGDFCEQEMKIHSDDEIGQLAKGFQVMRASLRDLVKGVQLQAEQVAAASEELNASAEQSATAVNQVAGSIAVIADGTEKQANSAVNISAVAEKMSDNTKRVSTGARDAVAITLNASDEAEQGREAMEQAEVQMKQIGQGSEAVQKSIAELAEGSREISEIVNLISGIAGQTNLLALNAAIEAARAGEYGKGFAVVAEEVRKLAEESNKAARQIGVLIERNQNNMEQAIAATKAGSEGVNAGIMLVNSAGETFNKIVGAVTQTSRQIKEISDSINRIAADSSELVTAICEIDTVSKNNAAETQTVSAATEEQSASMQEIASASQSLAVLASTLQAMVAEFKT